MKKEKIKKVIFIVSLILNFLYTLILTIGLLSVEKNKVNSVSADDYQVSSLKDCDVVFNDTITTDINPYHGTNGIIENYVFNLDFYTYTGNKVYFHILQFGENRIGDSSTYYDYMDYYWSDGEGYPVYYREQLNNRLWKEDYGFNPRYIFITGGEDAYNEILLRWLDFNGILVSYDIDGSVWGQYVFEANFNYNADFLLNNSNTFVEKSGSGDFVVTNEFQQSFICNGKAYNEIKLTFYRVTLPGIYYKKVSDGTIALTDDTNLIYFSFMEYRNRFTRESLKVCVRRVGSTQLLGSAYATYIENAVDWVNNSYRTVYFPGNYVNTDVVNDFARYTSSSSYDGFTSYPNYEQIINNGDNGEVTGALTLLGYAFTSMSSLFAIQILPGITLGLLLFLPLVVGIIVFVIWLIKR